MSATWSNGTPQGSSATWQFGFTNSDGTNYPIAGLSWEYVIRALGYPNVQVAVTTADSANGVLTADTAASTLTLLLKPAATSGLTPGRYSHALWSNPGTDSAFCWVAGTFDVLVAAQP